MLIIILGTFVSEDLASIAAGVAARSGQISLFEACIAAAAGIFIGDLLLWSIGYLTSFISQTSRLSIWLHTHPQFLKVQKRAKTHWPQILFGSRFVPGLRLPVYLMAGFLHTPFWKTVLLFAVAALVWAPALVTASALGHDWLNTALEGWVSGGFWLPIVSVAIAFFLLRLLMTTALRLRRFEFWPAWLTYLPLIPYIAIQALKNRSLMAPTISNPFIPHSGIVGESKSEILKKLPAEWTLGHALIGAGLQPDRLARVESLMTSGLFQFPVVVKPDAGQRGAGVKLCHSLSEIADHLASNPQPQILQKCHAGPREIGLFYVRIPSEPKGRIFSITNKTFPKIEGDGTKTLGDLVSSHERYSLQTLVFKKRHAEAWNKIVPKGETVLLCFAGNHCQGTLFEDGSHLITPALEDTIESIAQQVEGFYFGRFDIRFETDENLKAGKSFSIIELNGATSESTNIYDPSWGILRAYRVLFQQWKILFQIGRENRDRGFKTSSVSDLIKTIFRFYSQRSQQLISD